MKIAPEEYDQLREWFAIVSRSVFKPLETAPDTDAIAALDHIAARSPAKARQGLAMAIGDLLEVTNDWHSDDIALGCSDDLITSARA